MTTTTTNRDAATSRRFRCSDAARERRDPLIGTAPPAMRWLLVEQDGGWGREALTSLQAPPLVRSRLENVLAETGARLQLIRRPGVRPSARTTPPRWFVVDVGAPGVIVEGALGVIVEGALGAGWPAVLAALRSSPGDPSDTRPTDESVPASRLVLVCTNGRHDVCCAVRGRPVATALGSKWSHDVWETTHTGGDRFAGNVVVLPEGVVYGGLDARSAVSTLTGHRHDRPTTGHLRGFVGLTPAEQASLAAVTPQLGTVGLMPWRRDRISTTRFRRDGGWTCLVSVDGEPFATVSGHDEVSAPHRLTCSALASSRARVPVVDDLRLAPERC